METTREVKVKVMHSGTIMGLVDYLKEYDYVDAKTGSDPDWIQEVIRRAYEKTSTHIFCLGPSPDPTLDEKYQRFTLHVNNEQASYLMKKEEDE